MPYPLISALPERLIVLARSLLYHECFNRGAEVRFLVRIDDPRAVERPSFRAWLRRTKEKLLHRVQARQPILMKITFVSVGFC